MKHRTVLTALGILSAAACSDQSQFLSPQSRGTTNASAPRFDVTTASSGASTVMFAAAPGLCLTVTNGTNADGVAITTAACSGAASQQFTFDTTGAVRVFGDKCLDADMGRGQNGDKVQIWTCNGYNQQRWTLNAAGQLIGVGGKCVDVDMGSTAPGAKIQLWTCYDGTTNQKWAASAVSVMAPPVAATTSSAGSAELPRTYLSTPMPAVTGQTISVPADGDLQAALNAAQPGDQVVLAAGATYTGNFTLPAKAGMSSTQWITVRSSGGIPSEGTRVSPANAAQMAKIVSPIVSAAISTAPGAQGWRLTGLEVTSSSSLGWAYELVTFGAAGSAQATSAQVPNRLVLDRSYVHGGSSFRLQRCVILNSANSAVIDSYVADCHDRGGDSQAIVGWNGPGPYKITNNYLEGAGEVIMFGGADPSVPNSMPSDIEIRRNHITRPTSWRGVWSVKNLLELKMGQRVLIEGNVFENNWADAQTGASIVMSSNNQDGGCTWCITSDVTIRSNILRNTPFGFNFAAQGSNGGVNPSLPMRRVTITNNLVLGVDAAGGRTFMIGNGIDGLTITQNSGLGGSTDVLFIGTTLPYTTFVFQNNVTGGTYTLMTDDGSGAGTQAMAKLQIPAANVAGNVFLNTSFGYLVPPGNVYGPASGAGFASFAGGDLTLTAASPYRTAGIGGATPGADMAALSTATSGVKLQ